MFKAADSGIPASDQNARASRAAALCMAAILYSLVLAVAGPRLQMSQWYLAPETSEAAAEALAWLDGRLDIPIQSGAMAEYQGRFYNVFPPLWTMVCFALYGINILLYGEPLSILTPVYAAILVGPIPLLFYTAFRRAGCSLEWAAVMAFYAICGTCMLPDAGMIGQTRTTWTSSVQHLLAQTGMALIAIDLLGRRRYWVAGLGVIICTWSRQTCLAYALPVFISAWHEPRRRAAMLAAGLPVAIAVAVPGTLNYVRFGSPLETGYQYIFYHQGHPMHSDLLGPDGKIHVFHTKYLSRNFHEMFISPPDVYLSHEGVRLIGHRPGTGLWYGTPIFLMALSHASAWWRDGRRRWLMLVTLPIIFANLLYHGPTDGVGGYQRYTLDFGLIWLIVIAPWTDGPRMRWLTLACLAWSVMYFYLLT